MVSGKSHSVEKCKRRDSSGVFEHRFFCKIEKNLNRGPFGDIKNLRKKSHKAEIIRTKNFGQGRDSNPRPSAWQTSKKPN